MFANMDQLMMYFKTRLPEIEAMQQRLLKVRRVCARWLTRGCVGALQEASEREAGRAGQQKHTRWGAQPQAMFPMQQQQQQMPPPGFGMAYMQPPQPPQGQFRADPRAGRSAPVRYDA